MATAPANTVYYGVDYSGARPGGAALRAANPSRVFAMRYLSTISAWKALTQPEVNDLLAHGVAIGLNYEQTAQGPLNGYAQGVTDATRAQQALDALSIPHDMPIYFSVDFDAQPSQYAAIDAYLTGCASVIGAARVGVYGSFDVVEHCKAAGTAQWFWQTYAWSGGRVSSHAHVYQYLNGQNINGAVDYCAALVRDFGQYPPPPGGGGGTPTPPGKPVVAPTARTLPDPLSFARPVDWVSPVVEDDPDWPADTTALTPTVIVNVDAGDGARDYTPASWEVRAELATDLPEQVRGAAGSSARSAKVTLAAPDPVSRGSWSPWRRRLDLVGKPIVIRAGYGDALTTVFVGHVTDARANAADASLDLEAEDGATLLRGPAILPARCVFVPAGSDGAVDPITPRWAMDAVLRAAGVYLTPPMLPGTVISAPLQDSMQPERPLNWPPVLFGEDLDTYALPLVDAKFGPAPWGRGMVYGRFVQPLGGGADLVRLDKQTVRFALLAAGSGGTAHLETASFRAGSGTDFFRDRISVDLADNTVAVGWHIDKFDWDTETFTGVTGGSASTARRAGALVVDVASTPDGAHDVTAQVTAADGTASLLTLDPTAGFGIGTVGGVYARWEAWGLPIAGVQIAAVQGPWTGDPTTDPPPFDAPTAYIGHTPAGDLDASAAGLIVAPVTTGRTWEIVRDAAAAEMGALFIDRRGRLIFRNRNSLAAIPTVVRKITSRDSLTNLDWSIDVNQVRTAITIPLSVPGFELGFSETQATGGGNVDNGQLAQAWAADTAVQVPANTTIVFDVALGDVGAIVSDAELVNVTDDRWADADAEAGLPFTGLFNTKENGRGNQVVDVTGRVTQLDPRTLRITLHGGVADAWAVEAVAGGSSTQDATPHLVVRGWLRVTTDLQRSETIHVDNTAAATFTRADDPLSLEESPWRQGSTGSIFRDLAVWLAQQTSRPRPWIGTLNVVPDPRVDLTDVIEVHDPDITNLWRRAIVTGIVLSGAPGQMKQQLTVRLLEWTIGDMSHAWAGHTIGEASAWYAANHPELALGDVDPNLHPPWLTLADYDAMQAGRTLAQVDAANAGKTLADHDAANTYRSR